MRTSTSKFVTTFSRSLQGLLLLTCMVLALHPRATVAQWDTSTPTQTASRTNDSSQQAVPLAPDLNPELVSASRAGKPQDLYILLDTQLLGLDASQTASESVLAALGQHKANLLDDHGLNGAGVNSLPPLSTQAIVKVRIPNWETLQAVANDTRVLGLAAADHSGNTEQANEQVSALLGHIPVLLEARYGNSQTNSATTGKTANSTTGQTTSTQKAQGVKSDPMLTLSKTGSGKGSFSSQKLPTLDCGSDCQTALMNVKAGTQVDVLATPDAGSRFAGWKGGNCVEPTSALCTFVLNQRTQLTAQFEDQTANGANSNREVRQAVGPTGVIEVSAGPNHTLAIKPDGSLWAWGNYNLLGVGTPQLGYNSVLGPVLVGTGFAKVSAGSQHSLAIKTDGTLWAWGRNFNGQLGDGTTIDSYVPKQIGSGYSAVGTGSSYSVALKTDGSLYAWGLNDQGQLGVGSTTSLTQPTLIGFQFQSVAAGSAHVLAIRTNGTLVAWGANSSGQLGDGFTTQRNSPVIVGTGYSKVAAGNSHSVAIKTDNSLWGWGNFSGDGTFGSRLSPVPIGSGYESVFAGSGHSLALKTDGTLWAWGYNFNGQLGDGTVTQRGIPTQIGSGFSKANANVGDTGFAIKGDGSLWGWGYSGSGQLGIGTTSGSRTPVEVTVGHSVTVTKSSTLGKVVSSTAGVDCGTDCVGSYEPGTVITLTAQDSNDASFAGWSAGCSGSVRTCTLTMDAAKAVSVRYVQASVSVFSVVAAGGNHSFGLQANGSLWAWGDNSVGQLGLGGVSSWSIGIPTLVGTGFSSVSAGGQHSLALKTDGSLWVWGSNQYGQLGDGGSSTTRSIPHQIGSGFVAVSAGARHSLAVKSDGSLWAWGYNNQGELGNGNQQSQNMPVQVGTGFSKVSAGQYFSLGLKTDGTLWSWGSNSYGQLGNNTSQPRSSPEQIGSGYSAISAGGNHSLALKADGSLWAWGSAPQVGDGTNVNRYSPVPIATGYVAIAAGTVHSLGVKTDGSLWAWGANPYGQLGDGTNLTKNYPVQVGSGYKAVTAGNNFSLGVTTGGSVFAWGYGGSQLGNGGSSFVHQTTPSLTFSVRESVPLAVNLPFPNVGTVSSSPAGINCISSCSANFMVNSEIVLTAIPAFGSSFNGWAGACTGTGTCTVTLDTAKSVTANIVGPFQTLTVTKTGPGQGTVTSNPSGIDCGSTCSAPMPEGWPVTLTAIASGTDVFSGWTGACTGKAPTCTITMDAQKNVTAKFDTLRSARPDITPILMLLLD